ncbi:Calx-beta domain-containing protein [Marichromatium bheemlicum]|uniref:Trypsin-like serine protease n=1 Tax=Marichromatium bheemlicum TaxID=365339 RepID=A0ABX1I945_9GAMM|nr:Calx-beta domain-containing protein [Marichromatium bheemlicum]NKN32890.1 trypsin-like serine protease [Marichromatium bheemlicum]
MVSTVTSSTDWRHQAVPGLGYDGVVKVTAGAYYGTGTLLADGRAVLTAAHLFDPGVETAQVTFETSAGVQTRAASQVTLHPAYDAFNGNHDLALVWLDRPAPVAAERYALYRDTDELGQAFTLVGFGLPGSGATGIVDGGAIRRLAVNTFDTGGEALTAELGLFLGWTPAPGSQLLADFDDGSARRDAIGQLLDVAHAGVGEQEGLISFGDSGGPAFIDGRVAGVASYTASLATGFAQPDVDTLANSSFGEIAAWQRVSHYQQWIDQSLRLRYPAAPETTGAVQEAVAEGDDGTGYAYFLLEFSGLRPSPGSWVAVDYATRDGTAVAGEDYLAVRDTLVLYPGEDQAVIAVEVIGDVRPEADEHFFLDVFSPSGGGFEGGVTRLSASRTIVDDDWLG